MNRRSWLKTIAALAAAPGAVGVAQAAPARRSGARGIVLYCDLPVDPAREADMLRHFHGVFKPGAMKFKGFVDLKMLKLRTTIQGPKPPASINYRFQLTYESEELRQLWIASPEHAVLWPPIEAMLTTKDYQVLLTDIA